jgi:hypothetical protein
MVSATLKNGEMWPRAMMKNGKDLKKRRNKKMSDADSNSPGGGSKRAYAVIAAER